MSYELREREVCALSEPVMVTRCRRLVDHFPSEKRLWDVKMAIFRRAARGIFS